jgi:hypothetical protein
MILTHFMATVEGLTGDRNSLRIEYDKKYSGIQTAPLLPYETIADGEWNGTNRQWKMVRFKLFPMLFQSFLVV